MVNTGKSEPFQICLDIISPSTFVDFWKDLTRRLNVANSNKNRKKSNWGCFWAFLILTFLGFIAFLALGAGATYLYVKASEDPQTVAMDDEPFDSKTSDSASAVISSSEFASLRKSSRIENDVEKTIFCEYFVSLNL